MNTVLFVCVENSCRSQIAQGFADTFGTGVIKAMSAGSRPSGQVNPLAVKSMQEIGIDISSHTSKGFNDLPHQSFDYVITLGCKDKCPFVPADQHIDWNIPDPKGHDDDFFREVRDNIKTRVVRLINDCKNNH